MSDLISQNLNMIFKTPKGETVHALKDLNFTIKEGELLTVLGPSGCGKTTLGRTILRLIEAKSGEIIFEGKKIADSSLTPSAKILDLTINQGNRLTGLALEYAQNYRDTLMSKDFQYFSEQELLESVKISHLKQKEIEEKVNPLMQKLYSQGTPGGMPDFSGMAGGMPDGMSGGMPGMPEEGEDDDDSEEIPTKNKPGDELD